MKKLCKISLLFTFLLSINTICLANSESGSSLDSIQRSLYNMTHRTTGDFKNISHAEMKKMIDEGTVTIIDVRNSSEIKRAGMIKGAINIPVSQFSKRLNELDKNKTYITICPVGGRSRRAAAILSEAGFKHVYNADKGMNSWPYQDLIKK